MRKPLEGLARAELDLCIVGLMGLLRESEPTENSMAAVIFGGSMTLSPKKKEDIHTKERIIFLIAKLMALRDGKDIDQLIRETIREPKVKQS